MINTFTSTGIKFIHHPEVISCFKAGGVAKPISLQVAPTSQCNLSCVFCSNIKRKKHESLGVLALCEFIHDLNNRGLKTVEWTGGGDPTMYDKIIPAILYCKALGLEQGFITNGVALKEMIPKKVLNALKWIRISMNCLDYVDSIALPSITGVLGFSYVINSKTTQETLKRLSIYVKKYKPAYVRIVPNCQVSREKQIENNSIWAPRVLSWGKPYFYQPKFFEKPERCWWGYFKPFLLHDGYIYPCSSVVLNEDADRHFNKKYRWCTMQEFVENYTKKPVPLKTDNCVSCVFTDQNNLVDSLVNNLSGMENFI